ncbi:ComF family protein [Maridesulfovibrio bastinii]|uniref:ComF family protein n=1 Tax=Maridesulfovibrio bastinii TaxID=47157 RepID=UPI00040BCBAE|nr:ComF family protein [Maridesulfovibrio bastinii]
MKFLSAYFKDFFFQKRCPICSSPYQSEDALCADCLALLEKNKEERKLITADNKAAAIYFYGPYKGVLREIILKWKFKEKLELSRIMKKLACEAAIQISNPPDVIIPIPLHPSRLKKRGFNQSLILAKAVGRCLDRPVEANILKRVRKTTPQAGLNAQDRKKNLTGAFEVSPDKISGRKVLLVDDILTTGTTTAECCDLLKMAGCTGTEILVIARTPIHG